MFMLLVVLCYHNGVPYLLCSLYMPCTSVLPLTRPHKLNSTLDLNRARFHLLVMAIQIANGNSCDGMRFCIR